MVSIFPPYFFSKSSTDTGFVLPRVAEGKPLDGLVFKLARKSVGKIIYLLLLLGARVSVFNSTVKAVVVSSSIR